MAEFRISRIRYTWRNAWTTSTAYNRDDVVRYGGSTWICVRQHTASAFATDQLYLANPGDTDPTPAWIKMTDGYAWRGNWSTPTLYNPGDLALYGGVIYICLASHTSQTFFDSNISDWAVYLSASNWRTNWTQNTRYGIGDIVKYNGNVYRCISGHTSSTTSNGIEVGNNDAQDDSTSELWELVYEGIEYKGTWTNGTRYRENDLVKYGGSVLRCIVPHTSGGNITNENFVTEFPGFKFYQEWIGSNYYAVGDIVRHGGNLYIANTNNYARNPAADDNTQWNLLSKAVNFAGTWSASSNYKIGDLVRRGGNLYIATADTTNDGSSYDYLDAGNWELVTVGQNYRSNWQEDQNYSVNDLVIYLGNTYSCNFEHTSSEQNFPGDNGSGFFYWDLILQAGQDAGMTTRGDLLTYDLSRTLQGDGSTFGPARIPVGDDGQLVYANNESSVEYRTYGQVARFVYVALDGVDDTDDPQRGFSPFKPWRTIRFACEQMDDGYTGFTTIEVTAGEYEEITPIIVPARTVIHGAELRTTTIKAAGPVASLANDATYTLAVLQRLKNAIPNLFTGDTVTKSASNTESQVLPQPRQVQTGTDIIGNPIFTTLTGASNSATATLLVNVITNQQAYINFYINSTGSNPVMTGTNTAVTTEVVDSAIIILQNNSEFLQAEAVAYMQDFFPSYNFDSELCKRDVRRYIAGWIYDLRYTGNYKSLLATRYYRNAVLGCNETEDMFYLRDATGVRNCTLKGLESELSPPIAFDLYQKPLGGAYCSLDPGWGPNDDRVWITTRSPYIQGVTTIGTGCTGQKIDGSLHNGGNKSMVSNDFTQVLSDGIGAWVLNNGRAELVSVFTYYCHIGYFAEDGGVIRATNGNNSYGTYGAISDGIDATEVPATAVSYTRAQEASVAAVFAGDFVDEIQILEFANCGNDYTTATATFTGAGVDAAVVFEDFRDDAVFDARLLDTSTTIAQTIGGGGYIVVQNNAQTGTATTITIATNDANSITEYLGMRIVITSGAGTGQYGYITGYDNITKVVNVARESDDQPGWDHVVPGKPPTVPLLTNTTYRIEPRVIFSAPSYSATEVVLPTNTTWSEIVYGQTTEVFNNIAVNESGTGITIGVDAAIARFNITKLGRDYVISSIANAGAGYEAGQILTIPGTSLGGATPENDLFISVLTVSEDSTNSILTAERKTYGTGEDPHPTTGKFVMISTGGSAAMYSSDGTNWETFNMPSAGDWQCLAAGNNRFVAIQTGSNQAASSLDGVNWTARTMPATRAWKSAIYGGTIFVAVASDSNSIAYSSNGTSWTSTTIPGFGDSTLNTWVDVAYGKGKFVVLANSNNITAVGTYNSTTNVWSWTGEVMDVIADSSQKDWVSIAYGNNRFVAISSTGDVAYSFDTVTWYPATMPSQDGSTAHNWKKIRYAQGVFFAIGDTGGRDIGADPSAVETNYAATSFDGVVWTERTLASTKQWVSVAFGTPYIDSRDSTTGRQTPMWIAIDNTQIANKIQTGARALGRVTLSSGIIRSIKLWDPGSGYTEGPTCTLVDPNNGVDAVVECRTGDGVLAQPSWLNRGLGYRTASTSVDIVGDGYADVIPSGKFIVINDLVDYPGPGASLTIGNLPGFYTLVTIDPIGQTDRGLAARIRISPELKVRDNLQHLTPITIRTEFSQCRITGHDFLDIGVGNFEETNYPALYSGFYQPEPQDEIVELNRGRVFYTSTDQSGNFRAGELFAVEQATGIVTISADFFDLGGLTELRLGGIRVGGTGAVVREFSTDPLFIEDSNNIVPTQRAIKSYLAGRLSIGGSEIAVGSFIAGTILVGPDRFANTANLSIVVPVRAEFDRPRSGIAGSMLAQTMFYRSFR
jgi:hypothetical protein